MSALVECHRNHGLTAMQPYQFDAVYQRWFRDNTRCHDGRFRSAVPVVSKAETMPYFVEHHVRLQLRGKRGEVGRVDGDQARTIREGGRPGHALRVDVLGGLVELRVDGGRGEPDTPKNESSGNECDHVTDRRSLHDVLRQQIEIVVITGSDRTVRNVT